MIFEGGSEFARVFLVEAGSPAEAEGDRLFASHKRWMEESHPREGELALLHYSVAKGVEKQSGKVGFLLLEIYRSAGGVENHFELAGSWSDIDAFHKWAPQHEVVAFDKPVVIKSLD